MLISLIVAMDEANGIGKGNQIPWHLSSDLKRFQRLTMGHHILMGRKTYQSIGKILPGRISLVISRQPDEKIFSFPDEDRFVFPSPGLALDFARRRGESEVFIIGGGEIFNQTITIADRIYLTLVHTLANCDTYFPSIDPSAWKIIEKIQYPQDSKNQFPFSYITYNRQIQSEGSKS
jgi:dihydrofolate reductase